MDLRHTLPEKKTTWHSFSAYSFPLYFGLLVFLLCLNPYTFMASTFFTLGQKRQLFTNNLFVLFTLRSRHHHCFRSPCELKLVTCISAGIGWHILSSGPSLSKPDMVDQPMFFLPWFHPAFCQFHCPTLLPFSSLQTRNCHSSHHFHTELSMLHTLPPTSKISKTTKERLSWPQLNMHSCPAYHISFPLHPSLASTLILLLLSSNFLYPLVLQGSFTLGVCSADFLFVLSMSHYFFYLPSLSFVHVHTQLVSSSPLVPTCCVLFCTSWLSLLLYCLTSLLPSLPSYTLPSSPLSFTSA